MQAKVQMASKTLGLHLVLSDGLKLESIEGSLRECLIQAVSIRRACNNPAHCT